MSATYNTRPKWAKTLTKGEWGHLRWNAISRVPTLKQLRGDAATCDHCKSILRKLEDARRPAQGGQSMKNTATADRFGTLEISDTPTPRSVDGDRYIQPDLAPPKLRKATFGELQEAIEARAATYEDFTVPTSGLEVRAARPTILECDTGPFTPRGIVAMSDLCRVPQAASRFILEEKGDGPILARYLNDGLPRTDGKHRMLRTARGEDGRNWIRTICSERYAVLDDTLGMDMIGSIMGQDVDQLRVWNFGGDDGKSLGQFIVDDRVIDVPGDSTYHYGFFYENSEVRGNAYTFKGFVWRALCENGTIFGMSMGGTTRQIHLGEVDEAELLGRVNLAIGRALEDGPLMVGLFRTARDIRLKEGTERKTAMALGRKYGLSRDEVRGWMKAWEVEPDASAWGMVNGLTRYSQQLDAGRASQIEELAGAMLAPSIRSSLEQIERHWERYAALAEEVDEAKMERLFAVEVAR